MLWPSCFSWTNRPVDLRIRNQPQRQAWLWRYRFGLLLAQPTAAQTSKTPSLFFEQPTILSAAIQVMGNVSKALGVIKKSCDADPPKLDTLSKKNQLVWPLSKDPRIMNWVTNCKRQLKQKGVNTKGTDALWLIVNKFLSLTKKEWLLIKSLGPDDETKKRLFKKKR